MLKSPSITPNGELCDLALVLALVLAERFVLACALLANLRYVKEEGAGRLRRVWLALAYGQAEGLPDGSTQPVWPGRRWCRASSASRRRARGARGVWSALLCLCSMLVLDASHRRYHLKVSPVWITLGSGFDACAAMLEVY